MFAAITRLVALNGSEGSEKIRKYIYDKCRVYRSLNFLVEEVVAEVCISGYIEQADRMRTWEALNFDLIFDLIIDALIQVTESHMHELIMEAVISVSSEYFERVKKLETLKLIAKDVKVLIRNLVCRRLRNKWGHYISEELRHPSVQTDHF